MTAVYSKRFVSAQDTSEFAVIVPDDVLWIIRDIDCFFGGGISGGAANFENVSGGTFAYFPFTGLESAGFSWRGRQVFYAGEALRMVSGAGIDVTISGYELTLP